MAGVFLIATTISTSEFTGSEIRYEINPRQVRDAWNQTGEISVPLPRLGDVVIVGREVNLWAGEKVWHIVPEGASEADAEVGGIFHDIWIEGVVTGFADSEAKVLLGQYGIYGVVRLPNCAYNLHPSREGGFYIQKVSLKKQQGPCGEGGNGDAQPSFVPDPCANDPVSVSHWDAEQTFITVHGDWISRMNTAFGVTHEMWCRDVDIDMHMFGPRQHANILVPESGNSVSCDDGNNNFNGALDQYKAWIIANANDPQRNAIDDSFQLWTGRSLFLPGGASCYGIALANTVKLPAGDDEPNFLAISAVEAVDVSNFDNYDPDEPDERGGVSGQEIGHIYGEGGHPSSCKLFQP